MLAVGWLRAGGATVAFVAQIWTCSFQRRPLYFISFQGRPPIHSGPCLLGRCIHYLLTVYSSCTNDIIPSLAFWTINKSANTNAVIVSTIGTARGVTEGSWRPRAANTPSLPS